MTVRQRITKNFEIECLSPVHVGSGDKLTAAEYIFDEKARQVYFVDQARWIQFLYRKKLTDEFSRYIEQTAGLLGRKGPFRGQLLWEWLTQKGIRPDEIRNLAGTIGHVHTNNPLIDRRSVNDIARNVTDAFGSVYVPGSSIKGAFRTGILSDIVFKHKGTYSDQWRCVERIIFNARTRKDTDQLGPIRDKLEKMVFHRLDLRDEHGKSCQGAVNDVLRGLIVSDATCVEPVRNTVIVQKLDGSLAKSESMNPCRLPLFRECIPAGTRLRFSVTADLSMLKEIGIESIDEVFSATRKYIERNLKFQELAFTRVFGKQFFAVQSFNEAKYADLFLGGGTRLPI
ncbi:type III-A CRISPR-associated RAMP protein Csm5 [Anaeroglobus geminatus]|uniref:CRISPR system Cms protein Csm5 n=1 Tax=Anaeroglobus geminatus F0357 TaxID=861450 RepID=G9YKC7_9FIRM|nr:type III-A CRISPR-associated RAMP protein Csm5 [Anaeroglobus geminatus]EHM37598.1 CRISPR-associated RAMP protein, Csm5 family [Anaeroglobus geminatus F0357]